MPATIADNDHTEIRNFECDGYSTMFNGGELNLDRAKIEFTPKNLERSSYIVRYHKREIFVS